MAKKKSKRPQKLSELAADPRNPREITDKAAGGLDVSLAEFGDLSGIVFNNRTGLLVAGHQRVNRIREKHGDLKITDEGFVTPNGHTFKVRFVDWPLKKQKAANVAANSQRIAGHFTEELDAILLDIQDDSPDLADALLLSELATPVDSTEVPDEVEVKPCYQVVIEVADEKQQKQIYQRMTGEGFSCRVLTI